MIQWKFFGDREHTGNEQCQSQGARPFSFAFFMSEIDETMAHEHDDDEFLLDMWSF